MKISDALAILELAAGASIDEVKAAFKAAAKKYHPDLNPAGAEMMKLVTAAYDTLKNGDTSTKEEPAANYGADLNAALNAIIDLLGLDIEICGSWLWVGGDTRTHKAALKAAGFRWAKFKGLWHYRPAGWKSAGRGRVSMEKIRTKYGSRRPGRPERAQRDELAA